LGGDAKYQNIGLNPTELAYLETKKVTLDDISILTGVPKEILGVTSGSTYANSEASIAIFLREIIKPQMQNLDDFLDWRLIPEDRELRYVDPTPEDIDRKLKIVETASKTNSLSLNEMRDILGYEPVKNGDEYYKPFNLTPINEKPVEKSKKKSNFDHPLRDKAFRHKYAEARFKKLDRMQTDILRRVKNFFRDQQNRILIQLPFDKRKRVKAFDGFFDVALELKITEDFILPIIKEVLEDSAKDIADMFDATFVSTGDINAWIRDRAELFSKQVTNTTYKDLQKIFTENEGQPFNVLAEKVSELYDGYSIDRAMVIVRTETHGASQKGTFEMYKQAGVGIKIWAWFAGDKGGVRDGHLAIDGEERPIDMPFSNGLMFAGDPSADPSETINCNCSI
jgi:hypothetical protein